MNRKSIQAQNGSPLPELFFINGSIFPETFTYGHHHFQKFVENKSRDF